MLKSQTDNRIFGLDILRACAIISVVATHGRFLVEDTFLENFPFLFFFDGVDLFFVLSGFLIGNILLKEINKEDGFDVFKLANFWKRRWFRTLPNYYLILLVNFIYVKFHVIQGNAGEFNWKFLFFLQNFNGTFSVFFESWSLCIEEWFYIFAPLILFAFVKLMKPKMAFISTVLLLITFSIAMRIVKSDPVAEWHWVDSEIGKVVLTRLDAIGYGLLAAWIAFYYFDFWKKFKIHFLCLGLILHFIIANYGFNGNYIYVQIVGASLVPISAMFFLPMAHSIKAVNGMVAKSIAFISKISYSMYLINMNVVSEVMKLNFPAKNKDEALLQYVLYWIIVIVISAVIYNYFEKPLMNLRDKKNSSFKK